MVSIDSTNRSVSIYEPFIFLKMNQMDLRSKLNTILIFFFLFYALQFLWKGEMVDARHPFGGDNWKLEKYKKKTGELKSVKTDQNKIGEEYGVNTYWGRPKKGDLPETSLSRIDWLFGHYTREICWRKSLILSIVALFGTCFIFGLETLTSHGFQLLLFFFILFYMSKSYESTHGAKIREKLGIWNTDILRKKLGIKRVKKLSSIL